MFKIGDFSKLSQVSVKTLRYYDEIGLLEPTEIDQFTGYRYYSVEQLPRLNRILALKDLGFPLEQIAQLLDENLPPAQIRGMLRLRQTEIRQQLAAEQGRLWRVEARLKQIEQEGTMPNYEVVLKKVEPQLVASVRDVIPSYGEVGQLYGVVFTYLGQHRASPLGPVAAIYYDPEYREQDVDVEAVVPIAGPLASGGKVIVHDLPGVETMASTIHQGSYDNIGQAYATIMSWVSANGYQIIGPNREVYLRGPGMDVDPSSFITEVQIPVTKP